MDASGRAALVVLFMFVAVNLAGAFVWFGGRGSSRVVDKVLEFGEGAEFGSGYLLSMWSMPWFCLASWVALPWWWFRDNPAVPRGAFAAIVVALLLVGVLAGFGWPRWSRPAWYWRHREQERSRSAPRRQARDRRGSPSA